MGKSSRSPFRTLHALRIKGSATVDTLAELAGLEGAEVEDHLRTFARADHARFCELQSLWHLTPSGGAAHREQLRADVDGVLPDQRFDDALQQFLVTSGRFEELCRAWHVFNGRPNDHSSAEYDAAVIENLSHLHTSAEPPIRTFAAIFDRMTGYGRRLESVLIRILDGESNMFTGVHTGSYHDVWMELHDDVILTQGAGRSSEGRS